MKPRNITSDDENKTYYFNFATSAAAEGNPDMQNAEISKYIKTQLTDLWLDTSKKNDVDRKVAIANELIGLTNALEHKTALDILIDASQNNLFTGTPALDLIAKAISQENFLRSPLMTGEFTLAFIEACEYSHPDVFKDFLQNPDFLLMWMNKAPALEISRLIQKYFQRGSDRYLRINEMAQLEYNEDKPGKALLCYTMICPGRLTDLGAQYIRHALEELYANEPKQKYDRVIKSLKPSVKPTLAYIQEAIAHGCYLNLNKLELPNAKLEIADLGGASLNGANLTGTELLHANLNGTSLNGATLTGASLDAADLSDAKLCGAYLEGASLHLATLAGTDLSDANLSGANLQGVDLKTAIINEQTNFDKAEFVLRVSGSEPIYKNPADYDAELTRLSNMISGSPQEAKMRTAIVNDLLRFADTAEVAAKDALFMLKTAYNHVLCRGVALLKGVYNMGVSLFSYIRTTKPDSKFEPADQKRLRQAYEPLEAKLNGVTEAAAVQMPSSPNRPPPPVTPPDMPQEQQPAVRSNSARL